MRSYRRISKQRLVIRAKLEGAEILRSTLIDLFQRLGESRLTAVIAADIIRNQRLDNSTL
jgi:hypothetical protein